LSIENGHAPTPYPEVDGVLALALASMQATLGDQFVGLYFGDFNPQRRDIDFIAVTVDNLSSESIVALKAMHARLSATGEKWIAKMDGGYVPQHTLRDWHSDHTPCPFIEEDCFQATRQGSAVIQPLTGATAPRRRLHAASCYAFLCIRHSKTYLI
jgi:hypothetical protein